MAVADCPYILLQDQAIFYNDSAIFRRNLNYRHKQYRLTPHILSEMTMAHSKTWAILDKKRTNALTDNMNGDNSVVSEWKKTSDCLNLPLAFFGRVLFLVVEATNSLLAISSRMFPELSPCVNGQETEYPCIVNANKSEYSKIGESGNIANREKSPLVSTY